MIDPSSAMARLLPARSQRPRRETRRFVTRADADLIMLSAVSTAQDAAPARGGAARGRSTRACSGPWPSPGPSARAAGHGRPGGDDRPVPESRRRRAP
ncbi:hypothetical protein ACFQY7_43565 [Actinomadura luteofluorescens]|uniref:hypothetical protein n=1 Tax=Actinomadura luteofluorescens TaxID=46163 RepID=UPI003628DC59